MITAHYDPKPSFIVQLFKFYNRTTAAGESIAAFVAALCKIAEHCQYKDTLKDILRDCLVCVSTMKLFKANCWSRKI